MLLGLGCTSGFALKLPGRGVGVVFLKNLYQCLQPCWNCVIKEALTPENTEKPSIPTKAHCLASCSQSDGTSWRENWKFDLNHTQFFIQWSGRWNVHVDYDLPKIHCQIEYDLTKIHCQAPKQISLCPHIFTLTWKIFQELVYDFPVKLTSAFYSSLGTTCWINVSCFYAGCHLLSPYCFTLWNFCVWPRQNFQLTILSWAFLGRQLMLSHPRWFEPSRAGTWAHVRLSQLLGRDLQLVCVSAQSSPDLCPSWACWHEVQHQEMPGLGFSKENLAHSSTALLRWQAQLPPELRAPNPSSEWGLMTTLEDGFKISSSGVLPNIKNQFSVLGPLSSLKKFNRTGIVAELSVRAAETQAKEPFIK